MPALCFSNEMSPLASVESQVVSHLNAGTVCDLTGATERTISAAFIRTLLLKSHADSPAAHAATSTPDRAADPRGLQIKGALIPDTLDLDGVHTGIPLLLEDCQLPHGVTARWAHLAALTLADCSLGKGPLGCAFYGRSLWIQQDLVMDRARAVGTGHPGTIRLLGAHICGRLEMNGAQIANDSGPAIIGDSLVVEGSVDLSGIKAEAAGELGAVRFLDGRIGGQLKAQSARFVNATGPAWLADGVRVGGDLLLRDVTAIGAGPVGAMRMSGARVEGSFELTGATLTNASGPAFNAERLAAQNNLFLDDLRATGAGTGGAVRLLGASVAGRLNADRADVTNHSGPAFEGESLQVGEGLLMSKTHLTGSGNLGVVRLFGAQVGGRLWLPPIGVSNEEIDSHKFQFDGLTYAELPFGTSTSDWLGALEDSIVYAGQPYRHFAAAAAAAGHDSDARRILMAQRREQLRRVTTSRRERAWASSPGGPSGMATSRGVR